MMTLTLCFPFFFFNDTATTEIYTLSLHDALPIFLHQHWPESEGFLRRKPVVQVGDELLDEERSEEHTSELQSLAYLVCRLLLEKKKKIKWYNVSFYNILKYKYTVH